jgi:hypothetical protein
VKAIFFLVMSLVVTALCWRNLYQAFTRGQIIYRPKMYDRRKNPIEFWMIVGLCLLFGVAGPYLFYVAVISSLTGDWSAFSK